MQKIPNKFSINKKQYHCDNCLKTFTDLTGTICVKTKVALWKWVYGLTIEGVWKRYLQGYCDLFFFMYSNRFLSTYERLNLLISKSCQPGYCLF